MKKLLAFCLLILMIPSVSNAVEITISAKQAALVSGVAAVGTLVAHLVYKQYYDEDSLYGEKRFLRTEKDNQNIHISQWANNIKNLLALVSAAAGGFALASPAEAKQAATDWSYVSSFFRK